MMASHVTDEARAVAVLPPAAVCAAWDVDTLKPLDGGQAFAFVGGGVVLKPALDSGQFEWLAGVLHALVVCLVLATPTER